MNDPTNFEKIQSVQWGPIRLQAGIKRGNMTVYVLGFVFTMLFSTFVPQAQPFILTEILHIPTEMQGQLSGTLGLAQVIIGLIMPSIWGTLSDKAGRRIVYAIGFLLAACGLILYPLAGTIVALFLFRMLFAAGSNAVNTILRAMRMTISKNKGFIMFSPYDGKIGGLDELYLFPKIKSTS